MTPVILGRAEVDRGRIYFQGRTYVIRQGTIDFVNPQNAQVLAWNQYRIEVQGDVIAVNLNGVDTARYTNTDPSRGRFSAAEPTFIGLQIAPSYGEPFRIAASIRCFLPNRTPVH